MQRQCTCLNYMTDLAVYEASEAFLNVLVPEDPYPSISIHCCAQATARRGTISYRVRAGQLGGGMRCSRRALARITLWPSWYTWRGGCEKLASLSIISENLLRN